MIRCYSCTPRQTVADRFPWREGRGGVAELRFIAACESNIIVPRH